ncbi:hypothetical protein Tco_0307262 [Tanacetum coccineum]
MANLLAKWDELSDDGVRWFDEEDELGFVTPRRFKKLSLGNIDILFLDIESLKEMKTSRYSRGGGVLKKFLLKMVLQRVLLA